jgi:hypothetical protein
MKMTDTSPWDDIGIPETDFNVRRVAGNMVVPCFWGRDRSGACLFIVALEGDFTAQFHENAIAVKGINIDLRSGQKNEQRLILALERQVDRDLFEGLCRTLASALEYASDSDSALAVLLAHVRRWKTFLAGRGQHLSAEEVRGLFAEVTFLMELIENKKPSTNALDSWLGPEKSHQDFIFGNTAVEVKSLSGTERSSVRISSEDQLESLNDNLFLRVYRLSSLVDASGSRSLNELIRAVHARLDDADAIETFDARLAAYGYAPLPEYDQPLFVVSDVHTYRVQDKFPLIVRSLLPEGVFKVAYDIKLESLLAFECEGNEIYRE